MINFTTFHFIKPVSITQFNKFLISIADDDYYREAKALFSDSKSKKIRIRGVSVPRNLEEKLIKWAYSYNPPLLPILG